MAPKRSAKVVVKTTRKVVRETMIVTIVSSDQKPAVVGITDLSEQVNQSVQIPVEGESQEEKQGEAREENQQEGASKKDQENEGITDLSEQIPMEGKPQEENQTIPTSKQEGASKKDQENERITDLSEQIPVEGKSKRRKPNNSEFPTRRGIKER